MILYWIKAKHHTDLRTEGYIGITDDLIRRKNDHFKKGNKHLKNAFKKYGEDIVFQVIAECDKHICAALEKHLRPFPNIGWNIAEGGGVPPNAKGKKIPYRKRKVPAWNKGKICPQISRANKGRKNPHSEEHKAALRKPKLNKINYKKPKSLFHRKSMKIRAIQNKDHLKFGAKKICAFCDKLIDPGNFAKFHGEKCKMKGEIL